jgi:hypothetical protein
VDYIRGLKSCKHTDTHTGLTSELEPIEDKRLLKSIYLPPSTGIMTSPPHSPRLTKPVIPPLTRVSFTRLAKPLSPYPKFANSPCPFRPNHLPQLPLLNDHILAAIITSEPQPLDDLGTDVQTWGDEKHTLLSLAERGFKFFESRVTERVQDLAPGPFKDREGIKVNNPKP